MDLNIKEICNKRNFIIAQSVLILITIVFIILNYNNINVLKGLEIFLLIQFIFSVAISTYLSKNILNIINLFIGTLFLFNFGRIILTIFGLGDYAEITWFQYYSISYLVKFKVVTVCILALQGLMIGVINTFKMPEYKDEYFNFKERNDFYKIGKWIFIVSGILNFIRIGQMILFTFTNGYMDYYVGGIDLGIILGLADDVFKFSFYLIILSNVKWDKVKKYIIIYLISLIGVMLSGFRGLAIAEILSILLYVQYKKRSFISIKKLLLIGISLILSILIIGNIRMGDSITENLSKKNVILELINGQGYSLNVLSKVVENSNGIYKNDMNYLVYPFKVLLGNLENDDNEMLIGVKNKSLAHTVSYYANEEVYLSGGGMGGNYLGELYVGGGYLLVFIFNLLLGIIISLFNKGIAKNRYLMYFWMCIIPSILIMPREYTFLFILSLPRAGIFLGGVLILKKLYMRLKEKRDLIENNNMC
ncbi:MAG: O-antigen polysaccharide polymerase Wzy [Clostridium sp.]